MDILQTVLIACSLIISVFCLILILKKKNNDNSEILSSIDEIERSQDFQSKNLSAFESRVGEAINALAARQSDEISILRREMSESQALLRKELDQTQSSQRREISEANEQILKTVQGRLDLMQKTNNESLERIRANVDEKLNETLTNRLNSSFSVVSERLESVYKSLGEMKELSSGVTSLNRVFTNVKSRGTWAEYQLDGILEQTIPGMYERNFKPDKAKGEIVEFAVKIPTQEGKTAYLPIDSKFPVEDYLRVVDAAEAADTEALEKAKKSLDSSVLAQAKEIKKYISEPVTTPFAVMYLATEGLYSEVISSKSGVAERCQNELNVMIAGPSTITALLSSLQVGFRAMKINEKAEEIRKILAEAKAQYSKFTDALEKVRKNIDSAGKSLDDAVKRNDLINKKLKGIEGAESAAELPE